MRAQAAVLREVGGPLVIEEVELDEPGPGEVLVRMAGVGICHTDLLALRGRVAMPLPCVLGHEGAGTVDAVGAGVTALAVDDRVVLSFDHCGACATCASGHPAYCDDFAALNHSGRRRDGSTTIDGVHGSFLGQSSFATHAIASTHVAVKVDADDVGLHGPLGCGLLTGAGTVLNVLEGDDLAVLGAGTVGLAGVMAAAATGRRSIVVVEPDAARRSLALDLGATRAFAPGAERFEADAVLDTVGTQEAITTALRSLRSPGTCATVAYRGGRNEVTVEQGRLLYGRTLTGVIEGDADPHVLIPHLVDLHRDGRFPFERLITTYAFEDIDAALSGGAIKPVLLFG
jgi:aryl-alcohol dehydrogenase